MIALPAVRITEPPGQYDGAAGEMETAGEQGASSAAEKDSAATSALRKLLLARSGSVSFLAEALNRNKQRIEASIANPIGHGIRLSDETAGEKEFIWLFLIPTVLFPDNPTEFKTDAI